MAISSVGQSDGAVPAISVEPEQAPIAAPEVVETPAAGSSGTSGFDAATANPVSLNPQLAMLDATEYSRVSDSEGRKKGTNDDSIGGGNSSGTRPDIGKVALGPTGDIAVAIEGLSDTAKNQVSVLLANPETSAATAAVLSNDTFALLPIDQREKMINVMAKSDTAGVEMMAYACETAGDISDLRATDGSTVLDNLNRMVEAGLGPYVANVITDMVRPDAIWQGSAPTCTTASMQYELAKQATAEYSRLIAGLAIDGKVTMAGGGVLEIHPGQALDGSTRLNDKRSPSEAVFQAALMEFCNGDETYDVNTLRSTRQDGTTHSGLNGDQIQRGLENLIGVKYSTTNITSDEQANNLLYTLNKSLVPNRPVLVDMVIDEDTNHCMAFEGASNGTVRLRDPLTGRSTTITEDEWNRTAAAIHVVARQKVPSPVLSPEPSNGRGQMFIE